MRIVRPPSDLRSPTGAMQHYEANIAMACYGQIKELDVFVKTLSTLTGRESEHA
jgi:hypothetical protein